VTVQISGHVILSVRIMSSLVYFLAFATLAHGHLHTKLCVHPLQWLESLQPKVANPINWSLLVDSEFHKTPVVSDKCWEGMSACAAKALTTGRCRSTWGGIQLDAIRQDENADCKVTGKETAHDAKLWYDPNCDDRTCREEWVSRLGAFGLTRELADSSFSFLSSPAMGLVDLDGCIDISKWNDSPDLPLKTDGANGVIAGVLGFCQQGNNMVTNRNCMDLPIACRVRGDLEACKLLNVSRSTRTLRQKFELQVEGSDADKDGVVTVDELWGYISRAVDTDNDGCATVEEWVARWTSFYGWSAEFGRYFHAALNDGDVCLTRDDVLRNLGASGAPTTFFPNLFVQLVSSMCESSPSLYHSNVDCAMVGDTCRLEYPDNPACKIYVDNCGLAKYDQCVRLLPLSGECKGEKDRAEVHLEKHRVANQLLPGADCKDYVESCRLYKEGKENFMKLFRMAEERAEKKLPEKC